MMMRLGIVLLSHLLLLPPRRNPSSKETPKKLTPSQPRSGSPKGRSSLLDVTSRSDPASPRGLQ